MDTVSISPQTLYSRFGSPASPLVLDVRRDPAFEKDARLIPAALRPGGDLLAFARAHAASRPLVAYCVHGHEVSQEAARELSRAGYVASYLEGGIEAWLAAGLPTMVKRPDWRVPGGSRWITRARPKIDRIACPWLIQRFIDPLARFDLAPQCAGLVATSLGLSKRFANDHEMLANALPVYDGLYAWCRAQSE